MSAIWPTIFNSKVQRRTPCEVRTSEKTLCELKSSEKNLCELKSSEKNPCVVKTSFASSKGFHMLTLPPGKIFCVKKYI